jgi:hypothetical protein
MEKPDLCPNDIYDIMQKSWSADVNDRPTFSELAENLGNLLEASITKYYMDLNSPYTEMNDSKNNNEYLAMNVEPTQPRDYTNVGNPETMDYVNVFNTPGIEEPIEDSSAEYLSMQSPVLPSPPPESLIPFQHYDNVRKVNAESQQPKSECDNDCFITEDDDPWLVQLRPKHEDYLVMAANKNNIVPNKLHKESVSSFISNGSQSDSGNSYAPPPYSVVFGSPEYSI